MWKIFFLVSFISNQVFAMDGNYEIKGIEVESRAANSVEAKAMALSSAQEQAFLKLMEEKGDVSINLKKEQISNMVESFRVFNEKISGNGYKASFDIKFNKSAIDGLNLKQDSKISVPIFEQQNKIAIEIEYKSHQEWLEIKKQLKENFAFQNTDIAEISTKKVLVILSGKSESEIKSKLDELGIKY